MHLRAEMAAGRGEGWRSRMASLTCRYTRDFLSASDESIAAFRAQQAVAFAAERQAWDLAGEFPTSLLTACSPSCGTLSTAH